MGILTESSNRNLGSNRTPCQRIPKNKCGPWRCRSRRLSRQYHPCRPSDHRYLDLRQVKVLKDEAVAVIGVSLFLIMPLTREGFCLNYTLLWQNFHLLGTGRRRFHQALLCDLSGAWYGTYHSFMERRRLSQPSFL